jgi:hypothetical protein
MVRKLLLVIMRSAITTLTCALILLQSVYAIKPTEIEWQNATGHKPSDPAVEYSLLSFGSLRAEFSSDLGTVMAGWLKSHPGATVVPVITREPFNERIPNSKFIFVWLIDHEDNLNVYLVRHGCVAATQMLASFDDQFRSIRDELKLPKDKLHVPQQEYEKVRTRLFEAERQAKDERLGIWANPSEANRRDD